MNLSLLSFTMFLLVSAYALAANKPSVASYPPVVVKTTPQSGATKVDPKLKNITVTFSKKMKTKQMWSFVQESTETFPKAGEPHYKKDQKTIVLPVTLEPKKTYVIWINSQKFNSFRDKNNNPAVPYLLIFETK
jgi:RNA polymerase sigma-70 factor (ECF subfamily)